MAIRGMVQPSSEAPERELVARCLAGDSAGWRALYDRHVGQVMRFVSALGVSVDERDDAVQDVFVAVYRSLPRFRGEAQLSTWIYKIAARHVNRMGARRRMREMLAQLLWREVKHLPPAIDASKDIDRASDLAVLDRMLAKLSPKKRTALVLFEIEGLPVDEVAEIMGCPVNTVWSRLHHARAELSRLAARAMNEFEGDGTRGQA